MSKPLPCTCRPDPYIENGALAFVYDRGRFRKIQSDHHTGGGAFQYNYLDDGTIGSCGWSWPYLLSPQDLAWFGMVIARNSKDYFKLREVAKKEESVAYLLCWMESADYRIRLERKEDENVYFFDPREFIEAIIKS